MYLIYSLMKYLFSCLIVSSLCDCPCKVTWISWIKLWGAMKNIFLQTSEILVIAVYLDSMHNWCFDTCLEWSSIKLVNCTVHCSLESEKKIYTYKLILNYAICRQFILSLYSCVYIHIFDILFMLEYATRVLYWLHTEVSNNI